MEVSILLTAQAVKNILDIAGYNDGINAIAIQADGKLVGGDYAGNPLNADTLLARFDITIPSHVPFDFDGDGKSDISVYRPSGGDWYLLNSINGFSAVHWGNLTDKIVPADYDGDGKADLAIFRPSEGNWYILRSSDN